MLAGLTSEFFADYRLASNSSSVQSYLTSASPSEEVLLEYILREIQFEKDMTGKKVLVTAGATQEAIDPVRYITNHSTGKMGYALAKIAMRRGADVTLITAAA